MKRGFFLIIILMLQGLLGSLTLQADAVSFRLRVGYTSGFALYQFVNEQGEPNGIHVDLMDAIARDQSLEVEYIPFDSCWEGYEALARGEIDVVLGATEDHIVSTDYDFLQTDALSTYTLCFLANNTVADDVISKNNTSGYLAAVEESLNAKVLAIGGRKYATGFGNNTYQISNNQQETLEWLTSGSVSLAVCEKESAVYYLEQQQVSGQYTVMNNYFAQINSVILVRSDDITLRRMINTGIANIRASSEYENIWERWIIPEENVISKESLRTIGVVLATILVAAAVYIFLSSRIQKALKARISEKTAELRKTNDLLTKHLEQLRKETALRNGILAASSVGMVTISQSGYVRYMNEKAKQLAGLTNQHYIDRSVLKLNVIGPLIKKSELLINTNWIDGQQKVLTIEIQGQKRSFRCNWYRLPIMENESEMLLSIEDITVEEKERQAFIEAEKNRALNTLVAGIAHEIKNPLTAICTYTRLIPEQGNSSEFMRSFAEFVPKETERINALVESLVNYAKPIRGQKTRVNLSMVLHNCINLVRIMAVKSRINLESNISENIMVEGIGDQLQQAFINYLLNAIEAVRQKASENIVADASILVLLEKKEMKAVATIFDKGIGMTPQQTVHCAELFYTTKEKGTGLGMAIALQYIHGSGGTVEVESEAGEYTRIICSFDLLQDLEGRDGMQ